MQTYIRATPRDIEEAALIDGASRFRALRTVVLPVALPGLVSVFLVAFLTVWNAFLIPLIFTNSENAQSLTVVLSLFIGQYEVAWEAMSAAAVVTMIPPVVMALFFQRYVVRGLALGAVQYTMPPAHTGESVRSLTLEQEVGQLFMLAFAGCTT